MAIPSTIAMLFLSVGFLIYLVASEDRRLDRAARRHRELELEGIEMLRVADAMPEFSPRSGTILLPDGSETDRDGLLRRELTRLRRWQHEHTSDWHRADGRG